MSLPAVLATGLLAGGVSCAAVQGGLLAGLVARRPAPEPAPTRTRAARLGDDLAPVGGFLAGKFASHTLLGGLLGAVGGAVAPSLAVRTAAQILAGLLVVGFGLAQLGVRGLTIDVPGSWSRFVRGRARSTSAFAPALLGLATIAVPCGVTLSVEALALTSGSAWAGAAAMAVFVAGTGPLFAALGYLARRAASAWRGRLAVATGLVVVALGLTTLNGGLELAGSPLAASRLANAAGLGPRTAEAGPVTVVDGHQTVTVTASSTSYRPADIRVAAGLPTTLLIRSKDVGGCARSFVIASRNVQLLLPVNGDTPVDLGILRPGRLGYSCAMGMYTGTLTIVESPQ
ncbi:sulfite exporter TauE/SafE family protein [Longispora fulva]|uniref:Sulfite exporter TauE/SafE n=1 Tax=Longispora fulva TaxID=619741 RepID=A0A8J7KPV6_9ACTN|nr:sulfite exporter TauE/SafE family protein [Longispora fulva]MBG6136737.1 sulfite exporter TauE/SafE [Longispora fulva]